MFKIFFTTLIFGLIIGLSLAVYVMGLDQIQFFHQSNEIYPVFLPIVFLILFLFKRNTLYFPTTVHEAVASKDVEQKHWSKLSYPANLIGSWLSHFAGASLGREGTILVLSSSLAQVCKLNWSYYKPIVIAATLACVFGQPWVAIVIIMEMFSTNIEQKIFSLLMAWVGVLTLRSLEIKSMFSEIAIDTSASFFKCLAVVISMSIIIGTITYFYKKYSLFLFNYFKRNKWVAFAVTTILAGLFLMPELKPVHSLSLSTYADILNGSAHWNFAASKIIFTFFFTTLGFIGGDFVPSIIIGSSIGILVAEYFQVPFTFGLTMGIFAFFTGISRLKWTSLFMIFLLAGVSAFFWAYLCLSFTRYLSGQISFYKKLPETV